MTLNTSMTLKSYREKFVYFLSKVIGLYFTDTKQHVDIKNHWNRSKTPIIISFIIVIGSCAPGANADIIQASSVNEIRKHTTQYSNEDTLILLDIDYVLLAPRDRILRPAGEKNNYRSKFFKSLFIDFKDKYITLDKAKVPMSEYLISQILYSTKVELVYPDMPSLINDLNSQKTTIVGFTANSSGKYGIVQNEAKLHSARLKSLGYNFIKDNGDLFKENVPECISRILFTNKKDKGSVIVDFLKQLNKNYKNIVFVDDRIKNLISVQNALQGYDINYLGIHYTELKDKNEILHQDIADKQFQVLRQEHIWLSDDEARARLNASSITVLQGNQ
ncbi:MAG: DUF2608 domain-containing protein [Rickettsiaceae bacterium]|nr:DUF2608 domain-containing protein [Rickettsiaceae bacterium]